MHGKDSLKPGVGQHRGDRGCLVKLALVHRLGEAASVFQVGRRKFGRGDS